ncbi:MAG: hypothetical protein HYV16_02885 [Gammaproteobacteria bacterium]|nr:hypothetical protein [Gammaproteobacteria bacterium]
MAVAPLPSPVTPALTLHPLYTVPVAEFRWADPELNRALREAILARQSQDPGVRVSNRGGWHSRKDFQDWQEPCARELRQRVLAALNRLLLELDPRLDGRHLSGWRMVAWANVSPKGAANAPHQHSSHWSGVYYVDCGEASQREELGGELVFENDFGVPVEILSHPDPYRTDRRFRPEAGKLYLFPSSLFHRVEPYGGDALRMSIAFDLSHPGFARPDRTESRDNWRWKNFRGPMRALRWLQERLGI